MRVPWGAFGIEVRSEGRAVGLVNPAATSPYVLPPNPTPNPHPQALEERVGGILMRIEAELDDAEQTIGERLHVIDLDNDGLISRSELQEVGWAVPVFVRTSG